MRRDLFNGFSLQKIVEFIDLSSYTCLYPNGTWVNMLSVDTVSLVSQCKVIETLINNSVCPCDIEIEQNYYNIRYSLAQFYCINIEQVSVQMTSLNLTRYGCPDYRTGSIFISSVVGGGSLILLVLTVIGFSIFYRYRRPKEFQTMLDCLGPRRIAGYLMAILFSGHETEESKQFLYDVFVTYHMDDKNDITREILLDLSKFGFKLVTEEQFVTGASKLEAILEAIAECRSIIIVLTPRFVRDDWCREDSDSSLPETTCCRTNRIHSVPSRREGLSLR